MGKDCEYGEGGREYKSNSFVNNRVKNLNNNYRKQAVLFFISAGLLSSKFLHDRLGGWSLATDPFDLYALKI